MIAVLSLRYCGTMFPAVLSYAESGLLLKRVISFKENENILVQAKLYISFCLRFFFII